MLSSCQANAASYLRSDFEMLGTINSASCPSFHKDPPANEPKVQRSRCFDSILCKFPEVLEKISWNKVHIWTLNKIVILKCEKVTISCSLTAGNTIAATVD